MTDLAVVVAVFHAAPQFGSDYSGGWVACLLVLAGRVAAALRPAGRKLRDNALAWRAPAGLLVLAGFAGFAWGHSWRQAAALAGAVGTLALVSRLMGAFLKRAGADSAGDGIRFGILQIVALWAIHPFLHAGLLGAGDANSYALLVADFLHQLRNGVFPVFIGQSDYAFNGGFHPLRNAPYLLHLCGFLDFAGLRTLSPFALLNLAVTGSLLGAIWGTYAAVRIALGGAPWLAAGLAVLYGLCPGVLAPLYGGDMYPTFLTLPFVPWLLLGMERAAALPHRTWPWILQAGALAAISWAHPPVAAWAGLLAGISGLWLVVGEREWRMLKSVGFAAVVFGVLVFYLAASLHQLALPPVARERALAQVPFLLSILRDAWWGSLLPVSRDGNVLLQDIQLGYGLWLAVLFAVVAVGWRRSARPLTLCLVALLLLVWPLPGIAPALWRQLPSLLLVTNLWPMERLYLLLAAVAVFLAALAARQHLTWLTRHRLLTALLLGAACVWSAAETRKFFRRAGAITHSVAASRDLHRRGNILLSRTHSYEYLVTPPYFSYGHMDPRLETRLLDLATRQPVADGTTLKPGATPGETMTFELQRNSAGGLAAEIPLEPGGARVLRFDFLGRAPAGDLELLGAHLFNSYRLPLSGNARSFGASPPASNTLLVDNDSNEADTLSFRFTPTAANDLRARVTAERWSLGSRIIQILSQTPFRARVLAERGGYLETPRLYLPGYEARVDGRVVPVTRSGEGLVAIALPAGEHEVRLHYAGSRGLHAAYWNGLICWLALGVILAIYACGAEGRWEQWATRGRRVAGTAATVLAAIAMVVAGALFFLRRPAIAVRPESTGTIRLDVRLPWPEFGKSEPLVTTGRAGSGDFVYLTYVDGQRVQLGHDRWGYGGARSEPFVVDYASAHSIEINLGSAGSSASPMRRVTVKWDGVVVLQDDAGTNPWEPSELRIGENTIGGSTTTARFSGEILKAH